MTTEIREATNEPPQDSEPPSKSSLHRHAGSFPAVNRVLSALSGLRQTLDSGGSLSGLRGARLFRCHIGD